MRYKSAICLLLFAGPALAGELSGRLALNDRPIAGITVHAVPYESSVEEARREARRGPRPEAVATAVTNAKGEWSLAFDAPAGASGKIVGLHYAGPGVASGAIPGHWDTSDSEGIGETALLKGLAISGRVVDAGGRPVADAEVLLQDTFGSVRTDARGNFVLEGVRESSNEVTVRKPGYGTAKAVNLRAGSAATIVLKAGRPLTGVVLAADGKTPVAGAVVRAEDKDATTFTETDAEGRFTVRELVGSRVQVTAEGGARGYREVTGIALPQLPEGLLKIVLAPAAELRGRVLDLATRKGVASAFVEATSGRRRLWTRSGTDGSFVVRPAPAGDWTLNAAAPNYVPATGKLPRAQRTDRPVEIFLRLGATISGRVTDEGRRSVSGVRVRTTESAKRVWSQVPTGVSAVTADDGTFTLRRVAPVEALRLILTHPDFEMVSVGDLRLGPGETRNGISVSLRRGVAMSGVVTSGGAPLAGADVTTTQGGEGSGATPRSLGGPFWSWPHATSDANGRFRLGGLAPGDYKVAVWKTGYASEEREVVVPVGRNPDPLTFALGPEAVITGSARGKRGSGVADLTVFASAPKGSGYSDNETQTFADGSFRIDGLKPGVTYSLTTPSGPSRGSQKAVTAPADGVEFTLAGTGRIAGRVVGAEGRPVPEFQVTAQADRSSSGYNWFSPVRQEVSSEVGEFVLENVSAAVLEVRVVAKGYQAARVGGIAVEENETTSGVEVKLSRGASLRGHVLEEQSGKPVPDIEVVADSALSSVTTDVEGTFEIEGLPPGKVRVTARSPEWTPTSEVAVVREDGGTVELKLRAGASLGAAVVSSGGDPQAGAQATLAPAGQNYGGTDAIAGPDGRVLFSHLAAGRYRLAAGAEGRRSKPVEIALEADQVRDDVRVVIGGGATILATVTGLSPEERKQVSVGVGSAGVSYARAKELPDGRFEIDDVPPGSARAGAVVGDQMETGYRYLSKALTIPEEGTLEVTLSFEAGSTLTVRVLRDGQPVEGAQVQARPTVLDAGTSASATTDASGSCQVVGLKAGIYRVSARSMAMSSAAPEQTIELNGDQTLELDLPSRTLTGRVVGSGSGQAIADAQVVIRPFSADGTFGLTHNATTDSVGRFQMNGLEAGSLSLTAQKAGYVVETRTVSTDSPDDLVIEMVRGDGLDVVGRDGLLGTPLGSLYVRTFDGAGVGEIPSLKPGSYSIIAVSSGFAPGTYDGVPVPGPALKVLLTPGGTLGVDVSAERLKTGPLTCLVSGPRGPLAFSRWGKRGELSLITTSLDIRNFPPVSGTLTCTGSAPVPFVVPEGGTTRIAVK